LISLPYPLPFLDQAGDAGPQNIKRQLTGLGIFVPTLEPFCREGLPEEKILLLARVVAGEEERDGNAAG
jgi:hypothetical protein